MANVTVVSRTGAALLVQWTDEQGELQRGYVPAVTDTAVGASLPVAVDEAIPYAEPIFTDDIHITASHLNHEMKRHGLWTRADVLQRPNEALGVLMGVARITLSDINKQNWK